MPRRKPKFTIVDGEISDWSIERVDKVRVVLSVRITYKGNIGEVSETSIGPFCNMLMDLCKTESMEAIKGCQIKCKLLGNTIVEVSPIFELNWWRV